MIKKQKVITLVAGCHLNASHRNHKFVFYHSETTMEATTTTTEEPTTTTEETLTQNITTAVISIPTFTNPPK